MNRTLSASFLVSLLATACLTPKTSDGDGGAGDGGSGSAVTCADIRQGNVAPDTIVTLSDVVVTSPITQDGGGFFVQDEGGGPYSGMYIFLQGSFESLFLEVGDKVSVTGTYVEYYDFSEITVTGVNDITVTGEGSPTVTPVSEIGDPEQWESVLISMADQTFTTCPNSYGETSLSGGLAVNDLFYAYDADRNATVDEIIGLVEYSFSEYKLNPRDASDLVGFTAGTGCTFTPAEIHDQAASDPDGLGSVELEGLVVTSGLTTSGTPGFFVQAPGGGEKSGLFIFLHEDVSSDDVDVSIGDVVDITGSATVFYDMTEVAVYDAADIVKTGETAEVTVDVLSSAPADWNFWEGALVQLQDVTATSDSNDYGECELDWNISLDDWFYSVTASSGDTWEALTGQVAYAYGASIILPRDAADVGGSGGGGGVPTEASVSDVQQGLVSEGTVVTLTGVVATSGPTEAGSGFFVQDAGGGQWSGVYVYKGGAEFEVAAGDVLTVKGTVTEYFDLTEIVVDDTADVVKTGTGTPVPTALSAAPSDWEPYEGVLLTLNGVDVTSEVDSYGQVSTDWGIFLDDLFVDLTLADGDALVSVTGPLTYSFEEWKVCPRSESDIRD